MIGRDFIKLFPACGRYTTRRIRSFPTHVSSWPVDRRHLLIQHAQIHSELSTMMRRVQDAPPENPYSLAFNVKERNDCKPPIFILLCQEGQTLARKLNHSGGKRL